MTTFIDFNNLATGTVVDNEYKQDGVTISAIGGSNKAMIFDTANPTGGDHDLATNNLGNVLIISEDGDSHDPDDNAHGGTLRFAFDEEVDIKSLTFLDIEESAWVKFYDENGHHIKTIDVHGVGNNGQRKVDFNVDGVGRMDVILGGSGAIDNLEFHVPNSAPDAVDDTATTFEGDAVVIDLLANDTDADGDDLTVTFVSVPANQGTVVNNGDGTATFTPAPGFIGTAMVSYDISDGNGGRDWAKHFVEVKEDPNQPDGIVSNDNDGELIDINYDGDPEGDKIDSGDALLPGEAPQDDIVDANGGNDTIKSGEGDDDVYAGSGDDKVEGGAGDDLIFGDSNLPGGTPGGTVRESFEWDLAGAGDNQDLGGFTQDTGNVEVTFSILKETGHADTEFESDQQLVAGIIDDGNGVDDNSSLYSVLNGHGNEADYRLDFSDPVQNVSFRVNDIDGDGIVRIKAFDENGNPITVNLTAGSHVTLSDTDGVAGNDTADSNGGYLADTAPEYSVLVDIPGPVARIEIEHDQDGGANTGINVTDVFFDAPVDVVDDGEDGNDMLDGGEGEDTIFGEGGDDMITGGGDDDSLDGGAGNDRIFGGAGNDTQIGGDGDDTLGGADAGDDFFDGGAGNDMVEASSGDDTIFGGSGNDDLWASHDDDFVDGGTGDDSINGGKGRDEIFGGEGNDSIQGGSDEDTIDGGTGNDSILGDGNFKDDNGVGGADEITGGAGNDTIDGGIGADTIDAGADADVILGGAGDVIDGGAGGFNANPALNTDDDTLDLTGQGPFFVADKVADGNGNGFNGTIVFVDGAGVPTGETITFTEIENIVGEEVNRGPNAEDDTATVAEDGQVTINVLGNDSDPDGDTLTITEATVPADQGTVEIVGGQLVFTPAPNFNGEATISYTVTDGEDTDTAEVTVDVTPVNDAPDAVDDTDTTQEDTAILIDLLANDTDVDGDDLTVTFVSVPASQGTVVNNGDGTATFTPAPDFNGTAMISYDISDGNGGRDWAKHFVEVQGVNDGPVAEDDAFSEGQDGPAGDVEGSVLTNDSDDDGDTIRVISVTNGTDTDAVADPFGDLGQGMTVEGTNGGLVTINNGGNILFDPNGDFDALGEGETATTTVTYTISDNNGGTDTATVTITVVGANDDPVAVDDTATTDEDTEVVIDLIGNDTDVDGDDLTIGTVTVPADQGTVVDNGDGTVTFTPAPDFNGEATITYTVVDGNGGEDEGEAVVTVGAVNDAPDAINDTAETDEETPVTIDVLGNDTDPDGDDLVITGASVPAAQGTVEVVDNELVFTPAEDFFGEATISYAISDGNGGTDTAEVTVTVNNVNDGPVAVDDLAETDEDTAVVIDLIGNDTDADGDYLTIGTVSVPPDQGTVVDNGDGTVTFTPAPNFNGPATITYTVVDGNGGEDEGEATVNVGAVNDGPVANDDSAETDEDTPVTIDVLGNDTDPDGDDLTITGATVPAEQGTVEIVDNELVFTPAEDFNGEATISYSITDGHGGTSAAEVTVTVNPVNDDPVAVDDIETTDEDTPVVVDLIGNDTDADGDDLTIGTVSVPPEQGTVVDNGDGTVTFTPAPDFNGPATITYTVVDGNGGEDEGEAVVSVGAVNDGPVANDDSDSTDEDIAVEIDLLANDTDADGDDLMVIDASVPADQGTLEDLGDGKFLFTPADDFVGTATVTYTISDGNGGTDTADHTIHVANVNEGPDAVDDVVEDSIVEGGDPIMIDALGNDTDPDGDPLEITEADVTTGAGTVAIVGNMIEFTPPTDFEGPVEITYTISDPDGLTDTAVITLTVQDGIVTGTDDGEVIDVDYTGDPGGDLVDSGDNIFSTDPEDADDDIIFAGGGDDTVDAGEGDDQVFGGTGDDALHGGPGNDELNGEQGNDKINGGAGDDTIDGGADDDTINGGDGSDSILGGDGNDSITSSDPDNDLQIDKGYPGLFTGEEGTAEAENERDFVDGGAGDDTISTGDDRDTVIGGTGDDVIDGGIDDDEITGDEGNDRIVGGEGEDTIEGGSGNDTIYAGNDPDLGLDQLNIEDDGSNPLFGPDLRPDNGRDLVFGGDGDDVIFGADDDDVLFGEDGNDFIDGEIDDDTIDGGIGDDTLLGGQGRDSIIGGEGDDSIDGGLNRDTIEGGDGNDTIDGGNGKDELFGGDGDDVIDGGTGDDLIDGEGGNDTLTGSTGDDTIMGGAGNDLIDGNGGTDVLFGGDDRDTFVNVGAGDVVDGNEGGDDFDVLDLTGSAEPGGSLTINKDPLNEENGEVVYRDADGNITGTLTFTNIEDFIPCFTPGTLIATPTGERRVEDLKVGDRVITRDNGIQEVRWTGHRSLDAAKLKAASHLNPVLIRRGALGGGLPERDMMVSPQHRVLIASEKAALFFEEREVLVAAKHLLGMDGIDMVEAADVTYIHVMFDQHEVILSDGAWTESFQPGDQSMGSMDAEARAEIFELFPELATAEGIGAYTAARRTLKKHEAVLLTS